MALNVPQIRNNTIKRSGSSSSLGHSSIEHENDLASVTPRSRRNSESSVAAAAAATPSPSPSTLTRSATQHRTTATTLYAGKDHKPLTLETKLLMDKSPFFKKLLSETPEPTAEQTTFEDTDESAMAMFGAWLHGKQLHGPSDFHSTGHYLALWVLAQKFGCEALANDVMDLIRNYYAAANMTAPPYRLQYIYTFTTEPNPMRKFMVSTAAWRSMYGGEGICDAMKEVLENRTLSLDYCQALISLGNSQVDPRHGSHCVWHVHKVTAKCEETSEPWEKD